VERARASSLGFTLTHENAEAVAAICWRLAGLPLALELAAAKVRFLDPNTLLSRLDRALSSTWARDLPERQRTMRATLDWSHDLLSEPERELFRRLSVFSGGFTLEAAEAVGTAGSVAVEDVLGLLGTLVEQSLVVAGGDEVRYGMLEPVRQYALEKLEQSRAAEETRRRHARFFLDLAELADPELRGPRQVEWLERLEQENDNLRAAVSWVLSAGDYDTAARLGWGLHSFWWTRGYQREGRRWMEATLEHELPPASRPRALLAAASMAYAQGDYRTADEYGGKPCAYLGARGTYSPRPTPGPAWG
jgi:predicted ATPase